MISMTAYHIGSSDVVGTVGEAASTITGVRREDGFHIVDAWGKVAVGTVVMGYSMSSDADERIQAIVGTINIGDEGRVLPNLAWFWGMPSTRCRLGAATIISAFFFYLPMNTQLHASRMHGAEDSLPDWLRPYPCLN